VVLQPLPHIALVRAGPRRELARGRRTVLVQRPVEPEPVAQVDGVELECPSGVAEEAIGEGPRWIGHGLDDATLRRSVARDVAAQRGPRRCAAAWPARAVATGKPAPAARNVQVWAPHREM
jgi:hypothetical protein